MSDETRVHVTRIGGAGEVYGHTTDHCDPEGCNGDERYFAELDEDSLDREGNPLDRGSVVVVSLA